MPLLRKHSATGGFELFRRLVVKWELRTLISIGGSHEICYPNNLQGYWLRLGPWSVYCNDVLSSYIGCIYDLDGRSYTLEAPLNYGRAYR